VFTVQQVISILLLTLKFANWLSAQVSQAQWQALGYENAVTAQMAALQKSLGLADQAVEDAGKASDAELHKDLVE
jgi:hypothetical protein